jgi:hypothetical protein
LLGQDLYFLEGQEKLALVRTNFTLKNEIEEGNTDLQKISSSTTLNSVPRDSQESENQENRELRLNENQTKTSKLLLKTITSVLDHNPMNLKQIKNEIIQFKDFESVPYAWIVSSIRHSERIKLTYFHGKEMYFLDGQEKLALDRANINSQTESGEGDAISNSPKNPTALNDLPSPNQKINSDKQFLNANTSEENINPVENAPSKSSEVENESPKSPAIDDLIERHGFRSSLANSLRRILPKKTVIEFAPEKSDQVTLAEQEMKNQPLEITKNEHAENSNINDTQSQLGKKVGAHFHCKATQKDVMITTGEKVGREGSRLMRLISCSEAECKEYNSPRCSVGQIVIVSSPVPAKILGINGERDENSR